MTTGQLIRAARKKAGMTQKELGEKLNISYVNISQLENDQRSPGLDTLQRIADALGIPVQGLVADWSKVSAEDAVDLLIYGGQVSRVVGNMRQLNLAGRERVEAYSADMLKIAEYRENTTPPPNAPEAPSEGE